MLAPNAVTWITIGLLMPFWWALGLFGLACLGDASALWQPRVSRLFDRLERTSAPSGRRADISPAAAA